MSKMSKSQSLKDINSDAIDKLDEKFDKYEFNQTNSKFPLPTNFSPEEFTVAVFGTFSLAEKNSLSGKYCSNDTAITFFQSIPNKIPRRPKMSD